MRSNKIIAGFVLLMCTCMSGQAVHANYFEDKKFDIGLSVGPWFGGTINISDYSVKATKESSTLIKAYFDGYLVPQFSMGFYIQQSAVPYQNEVFHIGSGTYISVPDSDPKMLEYGGTFKARYFLSEKVTLKPGLGLGYRTISASDYPVFDIEGFAVNASCELQLQMAEKAYFSVEAGFLAQPSGGNDYSDVTFAPIPYILVGVGF